MIHFIINIKFTYFPPQNIFVVMTKLERLQKEKKKKKLGHTFWKGFEK